MDKLINAKQLRNSLPKVVQQVRRGARFTVLYRSQPAFQIVPINAPSQLDNDLSQESLYLAKPVGRSTDGQSAAEHDKTLYGR